MFQTVIAIALVVVGVFAVSISALVSMFSKFFFKKGIDKIHRLCYNVITKRKGDKTK